MSSPAVSVPQPSRVTPVSAASDSSDALAASLYALIKQQPFFKGLNTRQLQLLADSALEMKLIRTFPKNHEACGTQNKDSNET